MRGDDLNLSLRFTSSSGSAPRARGRPANDEGGRSLSRISPACAGTTCAVRRAHSSVRDQPRVRGDDEDVGPVLRRVTGSAPRARGRPADRAGLLSCRRDQPRVRGDDIAASAWRGTTPGSAPRARGRRKPSLDRRLANGISPACAGTTDPGENHGHTRADQPRVRGDDSLGTCRASLNRRISPACAGTTLGGDGHRAFLSDQPRVRGDDFSWSTYMTRRCGSAPRARGRRCKSESDESSRRISPACAGTT